jgi:hypothetical protein
LEAASARQIIGLTRTSKQRRTTEGRDEDSAGSPVDPACRQKGQRNNGERRASPWCATSELDTNRRATAQVNRAAQKR